MVWHFSPKRMPSELSVARRMKIVYSIREAIWAKTSVRMEQSDFHQKRSDSGYG